MARIKSPIGLAVRFVALLLLFVTLGPWNLIARDVFVMLSGGASPFGNNYSQYLQATAVVNFFNQNYPRDSVWTFFGAGNVEGEKPFFSDVYHRVKRDGILVDTWLPGSLPHNLPAKRELVLRTFREEILPAIADGGTLYLFVGDHGSQTKGNNPESTISLWGPSHDPGSEHGWRMNEDEELTVSELRRTLAQGIGKGRVVFCMTQCHSGGFHYIAINRKPAPNFKWFTKIPDWAATNDFTVFPLAAGFTATDQASPAAGCDPDPDPDTWAGYERFLPENLLGVDLFTSKTVAAGLPSFANAHVAATLVDTTIDKPYSTSEQYLERWSSLIESRLLKETNLTREVKKRLATYQRTVDGAAPKVSDRDFKERQAVFNRFINRLTEQNFAVSQLLLKGTRKELEAAINPSRNRGPDPANLRPQSESVSAQTSRRGRGNSSDKRKSYTDIIRPVWQKAVEANEITNLAPAVLEFEKHLLKGEAAGSNYFSLTSGALQREVFWQSGYAEPRTLDMAKAESIARWGAERRKIILAWAKDSKNEELKSAAERLIRSQRRPFSASIDRADSLAPLISEKTAAERTLFYRRVLAAWEFLIAMNERPALERLREITTLERTALPAPQTQRK